jgi:carboxyl-terminal processing protease
MKQRRIQLVSIVVFLAVVSGGWLIQRPAVRGANVYDKARLLEEIVARVAQLYVDSIDAGELYEMAIEGMLDRLNDPYTSYLRREAYEELSLSTTGNYGGVGIRIESRDGWITIVAPLPDTPGDRAGLESGDQITEIEGRSTYNWSTQQAADVMRGEPGTDVSMKIVRAGMPEPLAFTITRARIHVNYVEGQTMLAPGIGYLALTSVSQTAGRELRDAIATLRADGAQALVLDLRQNPGRILEQGVAIADMFLEPGEVVVEMKGRAPGASQTYEARQREIWPTMPMVVLVGRGTASAAEIIAGALQDHDRALVLGTETFGKGVAYVVQELSATEAVSVTTSRWYTPSGRSIDRGHPRRRSTVIARARADTAPAADTTQTVYRSDAGRVLRGGGGIRPDLELPDTLSASEQEFAQAVGSKLPEYRNALARYALDLKGRDAVADPEFAVSDTMLGEFLDRIRQRGVEMPDSVWNGAGDLLREQLGFEITRYVFGRAAELKRRVQVDRQVQQAAELLSQARTQEELLALAKNN